MSALAFFLTAAVPAVAQSALDALDVASDSTLSWCGLVIGSSVEDLYATGMELDFTVDHAIAQGSESSVVHACGHEAVLYVHRGRLEVIDVTLPEEGWHVEGFAAALEGRIGPGGRARSLLGDAVFFEPARSPHAVVRLDPEWRAMSVGLSHAHQDYIPSYLDTPSHLRDEE